MSIAARRERAAPAVAATTPAPAGASAEEFDEIPSAKRPCYQAAAGGPSGPVSGGLPCFCMCVCCCVVSAECTLVHFHPVGDCCLRGAGVQFPFNTFRPN